MRTGPLVDALIEHLVGDLGRYALETAFMSSGRALSWHELTHGRAAGCNWVTGPAGRPGRVTRGGGRAARAGDHRGSATAPCLPSDRSTGRPTGPAWHTARGMMGM